jgi:competence protein ComEA
VHEAIDGSADDDLDPLRRPPPPRTWRERVDGLSDATGTTPARLAGGALVVVVGLLGALWLLRSPAPPPEVSIPFASTSVPTTAASVGSSGPAAVALHVAGAVVSPGVYDLGPDTRVADAIEAAGGLSPTADAARINLAAPVTDGQRVYVLTSAEETPPSVPGEAAGPSGEPGAAGPVNLNTADEAALDSLPGVGPATAAAILDHRDEVGAFTSVEQLLDVPGIGDAKLEALRDLVTV